MTTQLHSFKFFAATSLLLLVASFIQAANISSTAAGGNWSATTTWVGGVVPGSADNVTIVAASIVTVDINNAACATLIVNNATPGQTGTLRFNNNSVLTVSGAVTIGGTATG